MINEMKNDHDKLLQHLEAASNCLKSIDKHIENAGRPFSNFCIDVSGREIASTINDNRIKMDQIKELIETECSPIMKMLNLYDAYSVIENYKEIYSSNEFELCLLLMIADPSIKTESTSNIRLSDCFNAIKNIDMYQKLSELFKSAPEETMRKHSSLKMFFENS